MNGINHALGGVIIHECPGGEGGGGGINHVLGEVLIHVLGVGVGNDISNVRGGGGGGGGGAINVLWELQIISWV